MCDWEWNPRKGYVPFLGQDLEGRAEVINAAVSGYTTYQELLLLEHYLLPYKPDLVIHQYTVNDNQKFLHRFDSNVGLLLTEEARRAYLPEKGDPLAWLPDWSYLAIRLRFLALQWRVKDHKYPWDKYPGFSLAWQDESWGLFEEQLVSIKELVEGNRRSGASLDGAFRAAVQKETARRGTPSRSQAADEDGRDLWKARGDAHRCLPPSWRKTVGSLFSTTWFT